MVKTWQRLGLAGLTALGLLLVGVTLSLAVGTTASVTPSAGADVSVIIPEGADALRSEFAASDGTLCVQLVSHSGVALTCNWQPTAAPPAPTVTTPVPAATTR